MKTSRIEPCKNNFKTICAFTSNFKLKNEINKEREKNNLDLQG